MTVTPLVEIPPYWIESSDVASRERSGTYIIENQAVAGYNKPLAGSVVAECFLWDDMCEKEVVTEQYGRQAPFADIESAKEALQMIARPALHTMVAL